MPRSSALLMRSLGFDVEDVRDIGMRAAGACLGRCGGRLHELRGIGRTKVWSGCVADRRHLETGRGPACWLIKCTDTGILAGARSTI